MNNPGSRHHADQLPDPWIQLENACGAPSLRERGRERVGQALTLFLAHREPIDHDEQIRSRGQIVRGLVTLEVPSTAEGELAIAHSSCLDLVGRVTSAEEKSLPRRRRPDNP
ncbi:MAG: hypothetical protein ABFS46_20840, partial [Myxococcota bacterium]